MVEQKNTKKLGGKHLFWEKAIKYNLVSRRSMSPRETQELFSLHFAFGSFSI